MSASDDTLILPTDRMCRDLLAMAESYMERERCARSTMCRAIFGNSSGMNPLFEGGSMQLRSLRQIEGFLIGAGIQPPVTAAAE